MHIRSFTYTGFEKSGHGVHQPFVPEEFGPEPEVEATPSEPVAPPQIFSQEEVDMAKNLAREEGRAEAIKEMDEKAAKAKETEEVEMLEVVRKIESELVALGQKSQESRQKYSEKLGGIALAIAKKVCGDVSSVAIESEISAIVAELMGKLDKDEKVKIRVSAQNGPHINNKFTGLEVNIDENMAPGDFRLEWKNGFAERDVKKLWKVVQEICARQSSLEENDEGIEEQTTTNN